MWDVLVFSFPDRACNKSRRKCVGQAEMIEADNCGSRSSISNISGVNVVIVVVILVVAVLVAVVVIMGVVVEFETGLF